MEWKGEYNMGEQDHLAWLLYSASTSERILKKRRRNRIAISVLYVAIGILQLAMGLTAVGTFFTVAGVLWYLFWPMYSQYIYKRHYITHTKDLYHGKTDKVSTEITQDFIASYDAGAEIRLQMTEVKELIETGEYFFVRLQSNSALVIPKREINNGDALRTVLQEISARHNVPFLTNLEWKW
jgi:hypothetical protein